MAAELQEVVDALAERLNRPILVEDHHQRVITYSAHADAGDDVRREAILRRRSPAAAVSWWQQFGISGAREPVRVPGNPGLHLSSRVCVPIRHGETLLGHIWFVDADESMTDGEIEQAEAVAPELALALYAEKVASERAERRRSDAARNVLVGEGGAPAHGAELLVRDGHFEPGKAVAALVVRPCLDAADAASDDLRFALDTALVAASRRLAPRSAVPLVRFDHGVLLVAAGAGPTRAAVEECVASLEEGIAAAPEHGLADSAVVGVGDPRPALVDARESYVEALRAARIAAQGTAAGIGRVAYWSELGVYRLLARIPTDELAGSVVHPGLERLLVQRHGRTLVETLEAYLDCAGSVRVTAERLRLHRQSLYYRLGRIERLAATDLRDGNERLALHLALRVARASGRLVDPEPRAGGREAARKHPATRA